MLEFISHGAIDLPWWGYVFVALGLTHITIASVTIYLHRAVTHSALDLHPFASHGFRLWLWLTTGMVTKEWVAVHRKHHAKCETEDDPHSPQVKGVWKVVFAGVLLYVAEARIRETTEKYGKGTPDDWIERNVYSRLATIGLSITAVADILLFGIVPGALIFITQIAWIPFWAAGVINGVGHYFGYRNYEHDREHPNVHASRNIPLAPFAWFIGGEELHNNHHANASSAKFSHKWWEFDLGWGYIKILEFLGLATVKNSS